MPGVNPLRYDQTRSPICRGDAVMVPLPTGRDVLGVVRHVSNRSRKVEVWVSPSAVSYGQARRRSVCRRDVKPLPFVSRRNFPHRSQK